MSCPLVYFQCCDGLAVIEYPSNEITVYSHGQQGPRGRNGTGDKTYTHTQSIPLSVWTAAHNLGKYPAVSVTDDAGNAVIADYTYVDADIVQITHGLPLTGVAYFN